MYLKDNNGNRLFKCAQRWCNPIYRDKDSNKYWILVFHEYEGEIVRKLYRYYPPDNLQDERIDSQESLSVPENFGNNPKSIAITKDNLDSLISNFGLNGFLDLFNKGDILLIHEGNHVRRIKIN